MSKSIRLSKQYGFNPSVTHCECCGKEIGIALFGTAWKDPKTKKTAEAPRDVAMGLCDDCQSVVNQDGLIILEAYNNGEGKHPERTGRMVGITKEAKERMFKDITSHIVYMERDMFCKIFGEALNERDAS